MIRNVLLSMCKLMNDRRTACSHAPDSLEVASKMRAQDLAVTLGVCQAHWLFCSASTGGARLGVEALLACASDQCGRRPWRQVGTMQWTRL